MTAGVLSVLICLLCLGLVHRGDGFRWRLAIHAPNDCGERFSDTTLNLFSKGPKPSTNSEKSDPLSKTNETPTPTPKNGSNPFFSAISQMARETNWKTLAIGALTGVGISIGGVLGTVSLVSEDNSFESNSEIGSIAAPVRLFEDILLDLQRDYVDPIDPTKLFQTGIKAMLQSLDPYTEFEDLKAAQNMQESVSGRYRTSSM